MHFEPLGCSFDTASSTLFVRGCIDELNVDELRTAIASCSRDNTEDLTVDLSEVAFLPSVGLGVLAVALRRADENGRTFDLIASDGSLAQRVLAISGLPYTSRGATTEV